MNDKKDTKIWVERRIFCFSLYKKRVTYGGNYDHFPPFFWECMPHIILEHSANIVEKPDFTSLFTKLHDTMMTFGVFTLEDLKSRAYASDNYFIADGKAHHAFVHVEVGILSGRSLEMRESISEQLIGILQDFFRDSLHERHCIVSLEVRELDRATYRKVVNAHASSSGM